MKSQTFNLDSEIEIKKYEDNYFDLAIVDPPYGISESGSSNKSRSKLAKSKDYIDYAGNDKEPPSSEFFKELKRISKNQIIFGANHFIERIPNANSSCWIVWDKDNGENDFADCELAYTSFNTAVRKIKYRWKGMLQEDMKFKEKRIHPNQKPVSLYEWILRNYAKENQKILDTHLGSGSHRIAANNVNMNLDFTGYELSEFYYNEEIKRYNLLTSQLKLF